MRESVVSDSVFVPIAIANYPLKRKIVDYIFTMRCTSILTYGKKNLNNLLHHENLDDFTNSTYVFGEIFCHLNLEKNGIDGLKCLLNYGIEADFYKAIEAELGIQQNKLQEEMMKLLKEYSAENFQGIPYQNLLRK